MANGKYVKSFVEKGIIDVQGHMDLNILFCGYEDDPQSQAVGAYIWAGAQEQQPEQRE